MCILCIVCTINTTIISYSTKYKKHSQNPQGRSIISEK